MNGWRNEDMIRKFDGRVEITLYKEDVIKSIVWMKVLKEFMEEKGVPNTTEIQTAIETMRVFVCEHFGEDDGK